MFNHTYLLLEIINKDLTQVIYDVGIHFTIALTNVGLKYYSNLGLKYYSNVRPKYDSNVGPKYDSNLYLDVACSWL